jgi:hypothetical protein
MAQGNKEDAEIKQHYKLLKTIEPEKLSRKHSE